MLSNFFGQRVRGFVSIHNTVPMPMRFVDADMPLIKLLSGIFNFIYVYKLLKKFQELRLLVSYTRV